MPVWPLYPDIEVPARLMIERGRRTLVLDLSKMKVPTAGVLGQLVALHNRQRALGDRLVLSNVGKLAYHVFEVTHLTELLDVRRGHPDDEPPSTFHA